MQKHFEKINEKVDKYTALRILRRVLLSFSIRRAASFATAMAPDMIGW
jgi:hypothetical protein